MAKKKKKKRPSPMAELREHFDVMKQEKSIVDMRLRSDMARDAAEELFYKVRKQLHKVTHRARKYEERSERWRTRLTDLLHDLATGPLTLPRAPGAAPADHDRITATFRQLKATDFPDLAQALQTAAGTGDVPAYQRFLVDEILLKGAQIVVEHLIRLPAGPRTERDEDEFLSRLRHHVAGNVCQSLARQVGYQVTPEIGLYIDKRIGTVLRLLEDLLTATPPGRLLVPRPDTPFDPTRHEPLSGRPSSGDLKVAATLFPGYVVLSDPPRVVEKALVYTERIQTAAPIPTPG